MSRYRAIFCAIWSDDKFPFMSDDAKLVWFHLYTNEMSTGVGIYKASIEGLAADIRWPVERYRKGLGECLGKRLLEYDETFHVVRFPKFFEWNRPRNPNIMRSWLSAWEAVPKSPLKASHYAALERCAKRWGKGFETVCETFAQTTPKPIPKQEQEQEQEQEQDSSVSSETDAEAASLAERLWSDGLQTLSRLSGQKPARLRSVLGKWRKSHDDAQVLAKIVEAEKQAVSEPVAWITKALAGQGQTPEQREAERQRQQQRAEMEYYTRGAK